ncbi:hypothetical protein BC829DRAFT_404676, partial [Chytridium lagenaria]
PPLLSPTTAPVPHFEGYPPPSSRPYPLASSYQTHPFKVHTQHHATPTYPQPHPYPYPVDHDPPYDMRWHPPLSQSNSDYDNSLHYDEWRHEEWRYPPYHPYAMAHYEAARGTYDPYGYGRDAPREQDSTWDTTRETPGLWGGEGEKEKVNMKGTGKEQEKSRSQNSMNMKELEKESFLNLMEKDNEARLLKETRPVKEKGLFTAVYAGMIFL